MSKKDPKKVAKRLPKQQREEIARSVAEEFMKLSPPAQDKWADKLLTMLVNMTTKQRSKFLSQTFYKKGKPTVKDAEVINQLITCFLHSIKPQFRPHYAFIIMKALKQGVSKDLLERLASMRELMWLHAGIKPATYQRMMVEWNKQGLDSNNPAEFDKFFNNLMDRI